MVVMLGFTVGRLVGRFGIAPRYGPIDGRARPRRNPSHEAPARTGPDASRAAEKHELDVAMVRAMSAQFADQVRAPDRAVACRCVERPATALRAVHRLRQQGRDAAASGVGR